MGAENLAPAGIQSQTVQPVASRYIHCAIPTYLQSNILTYLLHGAESSLRSWPVFAASQEIPCIFMEPESSLLYSQVPAIHPYPEPTPSSPQSNIHVNKLNSM